MYAIERGQHLVAAFYRNCAIHHFVDRAIAELVLLAEPEDRWDAASALRDLLKFEFFFPDRDTHRAQLTAELARMGAGWDTPDGPAVLAGAAFLIAHRVLRSFVDAQLVVALRLAARNPRTPVVEKEFLDECAAVGQQMLLQGRLHGPESLSRELFAQRAEARRQPRPRRRGPRGARQAARGVRRPAARRAWSAGVSRDRRAATPRPRREAVGVAARRAQRRRR